MEMFDGIEICIATKGLVGLKKKVLKSCGPTMYCLGYQLNCGKNIKMNFKERLGKLFIKGSVPYAVHGNSFEMCTPEEMREYFEWLSAELGVDVFKGEVINFEAGATVEVPFKYDFFANNHVGVRGMENFTEEKGSYKIFTDKELRLVKFYDAGKNLSFHKVSNKTKLRLTSEGKYDPTKDYVKFEVVYLDPAAVFKSPVFTLETLLEAGTVEKIKNDVLNTYKSVINTGYSINGEKGELKTNDLMGVKLKQLGKKYGFDAEQELHDLIDEHGDKYSPNGKGDRHNTADKIFAKINTDENDADIYEPLCKQLGM